MPSQKKKRQKTKCDVNKDTVLPFCLLSLFSFYHWILPSLWTSLGDKSNSSYNFPDYIIDVNVFIGLHPSCGHSQKALLSTGWIHTHIQVLPRSLHRQVLCGILFVFCEVKECNAGIGNGNINSNQKDYNTLVCEIPHCLGNISPYSFSLQIRYFDISFQKHMFINFLIKSLLVMTDMIQYSGFVSGPSHGWAILKSSHVSLVFAGQRSS